MSDREPSPSAVYLLLVRLEKQVSEGFEGVHDRLDALNGKVNRHETEIAVLTRSQPTPPQNESTMKGKIAWGGLGAGIVTGLLEIIKAVWPNAPGQ